MCKRALFFSAIVIMVLTISPAQATPFATVSTSAAYGTYTDSDSDTSYDSATPAEAHAQAWEPGHPDEYGKSDAWSTIGGSVRAYARAGGWRGANVSSSADATHTTQWLITSGTLGSGTPVSVLLAVSFDGELWAVDGIVSANASLKLGNNTIYEGSGTRVHRYGAPATFDSAGAWAGDFTQQYSTHYLNTTDTISFPAEVGQIIDLTLSLHTDAQCPEAGDSACVSDFSDSGSYAFLGAEDPLNPGTPLDVDFVMVPEPTTFLLLGLGTLAVLRKRKK